MPTRFYIATGTLLAVFARGATRPIDAVPLADRAPPVDRHVGGVTATFPLQTASRTELGASHFADGADSLLALEVQGFDARHLTEDAKRSVSDTPPAKKPPAMSDTAYRRLCEPPRDSASIARNGCVLRDQSLLPDRWSSPAKPPPSVP